MVSRAAHQAIAAGLTFWAYAAIHMTRKALSEVKADLVLEWTTGDSPFYAGPTAKHDAESFLGTLDAIFMFAYALGLIFTGDFGDRVNLRLLLGSCMCSSAVAVALFGLGPQFGVGPWFYGAVWTLNGILQSACWPAVVAVMGNWWGKGVRGAAMGLWSGNASAGNFIAGIVCGALLSGGLPWQACMFVSAAVLFVSGVIVLVFLVPHPHDAGLPSLQDLSHADGPVKDGAPAVAVGPLERLLEEGGPRDEEADGPLGFTAAADGHGGAVLAVSAAGGLQEGGAKPGKLEAAGLVAALRLPGTLVFSLCYACLKAVNYTMFFVLPLYLKNSTSIPASKADFYSSLYDVGGIAGSFLAGALSDCFARRSPVVVGELLLSVPALVLFGVLPKTDAVIVALSLATGFLVRPPGSTHAGRAMCHRLRAAARAPRPRCRPGRAALCAPSQVGGAANLVSSVFAVEIAEGVQRTEGGSSKQALATVAGIIDGLASIGAGIVLQIAAIIPEALLFDMLAPLAALSAVCLAPVLIREVRAMCARQE